MEFRITNTDFRLIVDMETRETLTQDILKGKIEK